MEFDYSALLNDISPDATTWPDFDPEVTYRDSDQYQNSHGEDGWSAIPVYNFDPFPIRDTVVAKRPHDALEEPQPTKKRQLEGIPLYSLLYVTILVARNIVEQQCSSHAIRGLRDSSFLSFTMSHKHTRSNMLIMCKFR